MGHTAPAPRVAAQLEKRDKDRKRFNQTTQCTFPRFT